MVRTVTYEQSQVDAFSRLRVSQETTLLELKQVHDSLPDFVDIVTNGTGAATHNTGEASTTLSTSAAGDYVIAQSIQRSPYSAGKSQLIFITAYDFAPEAGIEKEIGYYSSSTTAPYSAEKDGIFLRSANGEVTFNVQRKGTVIHSKPESEWSEQVGVSIDWDMNQIIVVDFQYLGVGRIRFYLDIDGELLFLHEALNANLNKKVYMSTPNQPIRWEIRQTGETGGSFTYICASVNTEGSLNQVGKFSPIKNTDYVNANLTTSTYVLAGMRLKADRLDQVIDILSVSVLAKTNDDFFWSIVKNPTVAGTVSFASSGNSTAIEEMLGAADGSNTITGGSEIVGGFVKGNASDKQQIITSDRLGATIDGTPTEFYLCVTPLTSNLDIYGAINWRQLA